jgi:hypothetical protein
MSESNLAEQMPLDAPDSVTATDKTEVPVVETRTPAEVQRDERVRREIDEFEPPKNFVFAVPNVLIGTFTKFTRSTDFLPPGATPTPEQLAASSASEELIKMFGSEYAVFFSAKMIDIATVDLGDYHPMHVPNMEGEAKLALVHNDTWRMFENYSYILRHHPSGSDRRFSDVHMIFAMREEGAYSEYVRTIKCTRCGVCPSPVECQVCQAYYCTPTCRSLDKDAHDPVCVAKLMENLSLTVKDKRLRINAKEAEFAKQQKQFAERNRGKLVVVRRMGADKQWVESEEIVVPNETE